MIGLLAMAAAVNWAIEFDDLTYADSNSPADCVEKFSRGEISVTIGFNEKERHAATLLRIRGQNIKRLRVGERLYARGSGNLPFAALVVEANEQTATVLVNIAVADGLWSDPAGSLLLFGTPSNMDGLGYRMLGFSNDEHSVVRQKLSRLKDCADQIGAD